MTKFVGTSLRGFDFNSPSSEAISARVHSDSVPRIRIDAGGRITWGSGSAAGDVNLYRDSADVLTTDDVFKATGGLVTITSNGAPNYNVPDGGIAIDTTNNVFYFRSGGAWNQVTGGGGGATLTVSDAMPTGSLNEGDLWFESDTGKTFVYYDSFWVEIGATSYGNMAGGASVNYLAFPSDIIPQTTNTYSLGSSTHKWQEVYVGPDSLYIEDAVTGDNIQFTVSDGTLLIDSEPVSASIGANSVALGTHTTGSYVQNLVAGTGVTLTNNSGEGATPTIAIGQNVATNANVTFNDVTVAGDLLVSGTTVTINSETMTVNDNIIVLNNNATGSPTENAGIEIERGTSANVALRWNETTDSWEITQDGSTYSNIAREGNIALGAHTTGNYMANVSASTGISISHTQSEGSTATISLDAHLDNLTDVTITGTPTDKQLLVYDNATSQWKNQDPIVASGIAYKSGVPASKTSTGTLGQLAIDGANGVLYICTGTNTWQKVSLNSANFTNVGGFS